ncbi:hypothetical protein [Ramlibacter sp. Leaf400]|uniref:hypothetical protein n=1 Tax=Ramlibacter sp. Leaf400 TaxID=1736365 RepID=UPI0012E3A542|nr:hypothetical protein [Ramlibacter sp. Leaf400]
MSLIHRSLGVMPQMPPMARPQIPVAPEPVIPAGSRELPLDELEIQHLRGMAEIAQVVHLRSEINLPAAALADPAFISREKKETSTVLSPVFAGAASLLELSASSRSGSASRRVRTSW